MVSKAQLLQFIVSGIMVGSIYAIIAIGFNMIFNATEVINFAQGEFVMLGGMTTVTFYQVFHLPLWFSCILSVLLVTLVGIIFERLAIHPMKHFSVLNAIIITVGASNIMRGGTMIALGRDNMSFPPFTGTGDKPFMILGSSIPQQGAWIILAALLLVFGLSLFYKRSIQGIAMRSTAWNKTAAELMGVNVKWIVMLSFAMSAASGAVAGVLVTPITLTAYNVGLILGLKGFCAAILGGFGNFWGAICGGVLLGLLESLGAGLISSGYKDAIAFLVLLIVLFLRPTGLFGTVKIREE
jgi:branched-chain amino acid transport system permease protein